MSNIITGFTTSKGFSDKLKELGATNAKAANPAETLRKQLEEISEDTQVTFNATNETILSTLNDGAPVISEYELIVHGPEGTTYKVKAGNKNIEPESANSYAVPAGKNVKITASLTGEDDLVYSYKATENKDLEFDFEKGEVKPYVEPVVEYELTSDTNYLADKDYFSKNGDVYTKLVAGTDYTVGDAITGEVFQIKA